MEAQIKLLPLHDATIRSIIDIDKYLRPEYLCCPSYHTINGQWIIDAYSYIKSGRIDRLKYHVTSEVSLPWRRAYQVTELYQQLAIFRPYAYLLDVSTIAFLEGNWLCSYLSVVPIIEGLFRDWAKKLEVEIGEREATSKWISRVLNGAQDRLDTTSYYHRHLNLKVEFLRDVLSNDFFKHGSTVLKTKNAEDRVFNRGIPAHMLRVPQSMESGINTANLFLIIDLIAELYLQAHRDEYKFLPPPLFGKIQNKILFDLYFDLYKRCAIDGMMKSNINRLHNLCYKNKDVA